MVVDTKIKEAEYFLQLIRENYPRDETQYLVSAFLGAAKSVIDHLLEDYNQKFGLGISLNQTLGIEQFEKLTYKHSNKDAQQFITFYKRELEKIKKDPIANLLINKRNINIHRKTVHANVTIHLTRTMSSPTVTAYDEDGNIVAQHIPKPPEDKDEIKWHFSEYTKGEVPVVCAKFLDLIKDFVNKVRNNFP